MAEPHDIDGVLIQWGDRLFYPGNRIVKTKPQPKLSGMAARQRAAAIRERIEATVVRRAPQVMVKVTGGGRGMKAIAAHFRYISKNGRLEIEDERGQMMRGKDALRELADDWRFGGSLIEDTSPRRDAFNIMLSMPRGTDPASVQWAARKFAKARGRQLCQQRAKTSFSTGLVCERCPCAAASSSGRSKRALGRKLTDTCFSTKGVYSQPA